MAAAEAAAEAEAAAARVEALRAAAAMKAARDAAAAEQKAAQTTAEKLGLPAVSSGSVPTPAEMQQYLRQVIEALQRVSGK
jgi:membrane protein involved in colicin uptake